MGKAQKPVPDSFRTGLAPTFKCLEAGGQRTGASEPGGTDKDMSLT